MTTKGEFIAFITATALLLPPIKRLAGANEFLQRGIAASQSVCELIDAAPELTTKLECPKISKSIVFNNVYFSFGKKKKVLHNLSFQIEKGQLFALVGPSGGGKSTLVNLLPIFYRPTSGQILFDDRPIDSYSLDSVREHIAYVGQRDSSI